MVFQSTALAAITMVANVVSHLMSNPVPPTSTTTDDEDADKSAQESSLIDLPSNTTLQATEWIYSKAPNALLFDFGKLNMKKEQIMPFIKPSLPPTTVACIRPISDSLAEITILDQDGANFLHKQVHSILKNKGLHLKDRNILLKPTQTLTIYPNLVYWQLRLSKFPKSMKDDACKQRIADTIKTLFGRRDKNHFGKNIVLVDAENILFSNCSETDQDAQHCSITILAKEYTIIPPPSINPIRKLIYVPFLKKHLSIDISLVK